MLLYGLIASTLPERSYVYGPISWPRHLAARGSYLHGTKVKVVNTDTSTTDTSMNMATSAIKARSIRVLLCHQGGFLFGFQRDTKQRCVS